MMAFASDRLLAERREMRRDRIRLGVRVLAQAVGVLICLWIAYGAAAEGLRTHGDLANVLIETLAPLVGAWATITRPWKP